MSRFQYNIKHRSLLQAIIDSSPCRDDASREAEKLLNQMKPAPGREPDDYAVTPEQIGKDEVAG